jgi:hypothetical protein
MVDTGDWSDDGTIPSVQGGGGLDWGTSVVERVQISRTLRGDLCGCGCAGVVGVSGDTDSDKQTV